LISSIAGDQQFIKASAKYFAVPLKGGGGPVGIFSLDQPGKFEPATCPMLTGHTGAVVDFDFNPFDDSMIATGSEDTTMKVYQIPESMHSGDHAERSIVKESLVDLEGHRKKLTFLRFNPTANNVLASTSADGAVKVWDIEKASEMVSFEDMPDQTQDLVWDVRGDHLAVSCKDKTIRCFDGRTCTVSTSIQVGHDGIKGVKLSFLGESGKLLSLGANRQNARELKVWDLKNTSKPLYVERIDNGSGVILPLYDADTNVIYLAGKGDGNIRIYEFEDTHPYVYKLSDGYRSTIPCNGMCMVPKRGLNIMGCETARLLKLTTDKGVLPLSFTVPRKSDAFQADLFPDCPSDEPAHTADEWMSGSSKLPNTRSLDPTKAGSQNSNSVKKSFAVKTVASVSKELEEAKKRIAYLEEKLTENGIEFDKGEDEESRGK